MFRILIHPDGFSHDADLLQWLKNNYIETIDVFINPLYTQTQRGFFI